MAFEVGRRQVEFAGKPVIGFPFLRSDGPLLVSSRPFSNSPQASPAVFYLKLRSKHVPLPAKPLPRSSPIPPSAPTPPLPRIQNPSASSAGTTLALLKPPFSCDSPQLCSAAGSAPSVLALAPILSRPPSLSSLSRSPQVSPTAAAPERAVVMMGWGRGRFLGSFGAGVCDRTRRFLLLLPLSLPFQPAVSLNCQRLAPIGRTRLRPCRALAALGLPLTRAQWLGDRMPRPSNGAEIRPALWLAKLDSAFHLIGRFRKVWANLPPSLVEVARHALSHFLLEDILQSPPISALYWLKFPATPLLSTPVQLVVPFLKSLCLVVGSFLIPPTSSTLGSTAPGGAYSGTTPQQ